MGLMRVGAKEGSAFLTRKKRCGREPEDMAVKLKGTKGNSGA